MVVPARDLDRLAVHPQRERVTPGVTLDERRTGRRPTRSTTAAAVRGASRMPLR